MNRTAEAGAGTGAFSSDPLLSAKLEAGALPEGTDVRFTENSVTMVFPAGAAWEQQGGEVWIRYFAPAPDVDGFRVSGGELRSFEDGESGGTDEYGRRYCEIRYQAARKEDGVWTCPGGAHAGAVEWYRRGAPAGEETVQVFLSGKAA